MLRWYVTYTRRAGEVIAESNLKRQGYEVYLPRLAQAVRRHGRWLEQVVAFFPRCFFLRLNEGSQALGPVRSTVGVASFVSFGSSYANVPDQLIRVLQERSDAQSGLHRLEVPALPEPGTGVRISSGPFDGIERVFERESGDVRAVVLLNILGGHTRVHVPLESVLSGLSA